MIRIVRGLSIDLVLATLLACYTFRGYTYLNLLTADRGPLFKVTLTRRFKY